MRTICLVMIGLIVVLFSLPLLTGHEGSHPGGSRNAPLRNRVKISVKNDFRQIQANGLPDHQHGQFPNRRNPHSIESQNYNYRVQTEPKVASKITYLGRSPFGIAINGVPFDPGTAEYWDNDPTSGWRYEALTGEIDLGVDSSHAHVQPNGAYHYHGIPTELLKKLGGNREQMLLVGYAADGFPIYAPNAYSKADDANSGLKEMQSSYQLKKGSRPNGPRGRYDGSYVEDFEYIAESGDLDECNGRTGITPEYPAGTYYYVLTEDFPFIPRAFKGTPNNSFKRRPPRGRGPNNGSPARNGRPPRR